MYELARQFIFSITFILITSRPQIVHCLGPPLYERLR